MVAVEYLALKDKETIKELKEWAGYSYIYPVLIVSCLNLNNNIS